MPPEPRTVAAEGPLNGKTVDRVTVTDQIGYGWAMARIHELGAAAA